MRTSCVAPSTWRPARRRSRSWPPERWRSSDFQSDRPVTEPSSPVTSLSRRTRGTKSARNTGGAGRNYTRSCGGGYRPRRRNPAVAAPWPYRAAFLVPPLCHWSSRPRKTPSCGSGGEEPDALWASPPYLTTTPSRGPRERVGTPEVVHEVIRARIRPRAGGDFRRSVWHEKTPPEPSVLAHAGFWDSGLCLVLLSHHEGGPVVHQRPALVKEVRSQIGSDSIGALQVRQDVLGNEGQP